MNQTDTIHLLSQCQSGIQMAVNAINDVLPAVEDSKLLEELSSCKAEHERLGVQTQELLAQLHQPEKSANPMALGFSWLKTNIKLAITPGDHCVADLITDGCHMGIKSLHKSCNRYTGAGQQAKQIAQDLIRSESQLTQTLGPYL